MVFYNDYIYVLYNTNTDENSTINVYRLSIQNYTWEYSTNFSTLAFDNGFLIDNSIYFSSNLDLYKLDLVTYKLLNMGNFYNQNDYAIASTQDSIFVFGGSYYNTNLLVKLVLSDDKNSFTSILYKDFTYPDVRISHSLTQINSNLYLFGGENQGSYFNDLWVYKTKSKSWASAIATGSNPDPRSNHAAASYGDLLLIWGGEGSSGYLSDMHMYHAVTYVWTKITPTSGLSPSDRKGACIVFEMPLVYIFGGITAYNVNRDLWKYDFSQNKYTLISQYPHSGVAYSNCQVENNIFYSFCGSGKNDIVFNFYLEFNLTSNTWSKLPAPGCYTDGIDIKLGDYVIDLGGRSLNKVSSNSFTISKNSTPQFMLNISNYFPYDVGFGYVGSTLYFLYGGSTTVYGKLDYNRGTTIFGTIDMIQVSQEYNISLVCSPGYYFYNFTCVPCPSGTYSSGFGNRNCSKCERGKYNNDIAATSISQCYPCPYGTFNNVLGAVLCLNCPQGYICDIGSHSPKSITYNITATSIQPSNYVPPDYSTTLIGFQLFFGLFSVLTIGFLFIFARNKLEVFDFYNLKHTHNIGEAVTLKKTNIGGIFTLLFISLALVITATILIGYFLNNTKESKALQPLSVLQKQVEYFNADLEMIVSFNAYGDACVIDSECSPLIYVEINDFKSKGSYSISCVLIEASCIIKFECLRCEIDSQSSVSIYLNEKFSYASSISVNLTSTSSIPDSISSEISTISTTDNQLFIGSIPTSFYFTLIPSLFTSSVGTTSIQDTGYHVLINSLPDQGSQYSIHNIQKFSLLQVVVYLFQSSSGLYTNRYPDQTLIFVISGLLGSVSGVMGALGFLMGKFEKNLRKYTQRKKHKADYLKLKTQRFILVDSLTSQSHQVSEQKLEKVPSESKEFIKIV